MILSPPRDQERELNGPRSRIPVCTRWPHLLTESSILANLNNEVAQRQASAANMLRDGRQRSSSFGPTNTYTSNASNYNASPDYRTTNVNQYSGATNLTPTGGAMHSPPLSRPPAFANAGTLPYATTSGTIYTHSSTPTSGTPNYTPSSGTPNYNTPSTGTPTYSPTSTNYNTPTPGTPSFSPTSTLNYNTSTLGLAPPGGHTIIANYTNQLPVTMTYNPKNFTNPATPNYSNYNTTGTGGKGHPTGSYPYSSSGTPPASLTGSPGYQTTTPAGYPPGYTPATSTASYPAGYPPNYSSGSSVPSVVPAPAFTPNPVLTAPSSGPRPTLQRQGSGINMTYNPTPTSKLSMDCLFTFLH